VGQSLSHLLVHSVFSTKDRCPFFRPEDIRSEIYAYMAGILKNLECHPIKIGGIEDHVHILFALSKNIAFLGIDWVPERLFVKAAERERD
jgi:putative transposase